MNLKSSLSNLFSTAKLRRFLADSKYSCENFSDLLRRSRRDATNRLQEPNPCREIKIKLYFPHPPFTSMNL